MFEIGSNLVGMALWDISCPLLQSIADIGTTQRDIARKSSTGYTMNNLLLFDSIPSKEIARLHSVLKNLLVTCTVSSISNESHTPLKC